jgi:Tfp pilus assembly protein PilF
MESNVISIYVKPLNCEPLPWNSFAALATVSLDGLAVRSARRRAPQALRPRVLLSRVLLQEGRDLAAAEKALRDVLAMDPNHAEAKHNLAILLSERRRDH